MIQALWKASALGPFVGDCNSVVLSVIPSESSGLVDSFLSSSVGNIEAKIFQLLIIEIVDSVQFLEANQTCITRRDFFNDSWPSEIEVQYLLRCMRVGI